MSSEFPQPEKVTPPSAQPPPPDKRVPLADSHLPGAGARFGDQGRDYMEMPTPLGEPEVLGTTIGVFLSWLVIIGLTCFIFSMTTYVQFFKPHDNQPQDISKSELMPLNLQGKMLLGTKLVLSDQFAANDDSFETQIEALNTGPPESRYGAAILMNEFVDAATAIKQLAKVDELIVTLNYETTPKQQRLREIVGGLLEQYENEDYDCDAVPEVDREFLKHELGWVGGLALVPSQTPHKKVREQIEKEAQTSLIIGWSAFAAGILALFFGMLTAFVLMVMSASGKLSPNFRTASKRGRVYGETFAIWFVLFWGSQIAVAVFGSLFLTDVQSMAATLAVFFASLFVLAWPVARGIPFPVVREDIGWKLKNPIVETACAVVAYLSILPFLACSMIVVFVLLISTAALQQNSNSNELSSVTSAGHPVQEQFAGGDPAMMICVLLALCVAAPIVEETMFRGVLYRHLRDATTGWQKIMSIIFSAIVSSLIFASVHPQGIIGIPLLAMLAMGFALVREWRSSLIAPMIMHAINNGCVALLLFLVL